MDGFWENVSRYPRYMVSLILGIFIFFWEQIKPLFSNPITAIVTVGFIVGIFAFLYFTLQAMLGLNIA